jgi:hypothetical protein
VAAYGRRLDHHGRPLGDEIQIMGWSSVHSLGPKPVAYDSANDQYLVVADAGFLRSRDIYGQLVDGNGQLVGHTFPITGPKAHGDDEWPDVAYDPGRQQFLAVWHSRRNPRETRGFTDIYGQLISAQGQRVGYNFRISGRNATDAEHQPQVAHSVVSGDYVVVWIDGRNRSPDIYGHAVSGEGRRVGSDRRISYGWQGDYWPAITYNAVDDQYMVVWQDSRDGWTRSTDIYGQRVATE